MSDAVIVELMMIIVAYYSLEMATDSNKPTPQTHTQDAMGLCVSSAFRLSLSDVLCATREDLGVSTSHQPKNAHNSRTNMESKSVGSPLPL